MFPGQLIQEPVVAQDGQIYDRLALEAWFHYAKAEGLVKRESYIEPFNQDLPALDVKVNGNKLQVRAWQASNGGPEFHARPGRTENNPLFDPPWPRTGGTDDSAGTGTRASTKYIEPEEEAGNQIYVDTVRFCDRGLCGGNCCRVSFEFVCGKNVTKSCWTFRGLPCRHRGRLI